MDKTAEAIAFLGGNSSGVGKAANKLAGRNKVLNDAEEAALGTVTDTPKEMDNSTFFKGGMTDAEKAKKAAGLAKILRNRQ